MAKKRGGARKITSRPYGKLQVVESKRKTFGKERQAQFFAALADTCNVRASARAAGVSWQCIYQKRDRDPEFRARLREAVVEAYEGLEWEALAEARGAGEQTSDGEPPHPAHASRESPSPQGARGKLDKDLALHLLREHKRSLAGGAALGRTGAPLGGVERGRGLFHCAAAGAEGADRGGRKEKTPPPSFGWFPSPAKAGEEILVNAVPAWLEALAGLEEWRLSRILRNAPAPIRRRLFEEWSWQAHAGQVEPDGDWRTWLIMAGRGFGKTRAGAEWALARAREVEGARIALVGATIEEVIKVMIEGESGLKAAARTGEEVRWWPSRSIVGLPNGGIGLPYSGARPGKLRGPQHHFAWCDEIAKWRLPDESWDNLMLGMRLGSKPRVVVTTTPQPIPLLKRIQRLKGTVTTGGRTSDNVHLPPEFVEAVTDAYGGTRLGRQELDGVYLEEREGALWSRALIEQCRVAFPLPSREGTGVGQRSGGSMPPERSLTPQNSLRSYPPPAPPLQGGESFARIVVGVDPPAGVNGTCGIVVVGLSRDGVAYVLADSSVHGATPERWADSVAATAEAWRADRVIAEANQGGAMVETVLRAVEKNLPVKLRHASEAKGKRAEPVAALFEAGRARFAGIFPDLEDQLVGLMPGGGYALSGSPDRADAMVWAVSELMFRQSREPRIRSL